MPPRLRRKTRKKRKLWRRRCQTPRQGGMKRKMQTKLEAHLSFLLHAQQTSHSGWLDRLGTTTGAGICFFNVHQRSRLKQRRRRREEEEGGGGGLVPEAVSVTCFSAAASDKGEFCVLAEMRADRMDGRTARAALTQPVVGGCARTAEM